MSRSIRTALLASGALASSLVSSAAFAEPMSVRSLANTDSDAPARSIATPNPADPASSPATVPEFIPIDHATQPQAGNTQVQVPSQVTDKDVKSEFGFGVALLVLGVLLTAAVLVGLFMLVTRRTWDSNHPPVSQRRLSERAP